MNLPKRELLFAAEVPEAEVPPKRRRPTEPPRMWGSVHDIPPGTLVLPEGESSFLYVTSRGGGWWMSPNGYGQFPEIAEVERQGQGWTLNDRTEHKGPFREVQRW